MTGGVMAEAATATASPVEGVLAMIDERAEALAQFRAAVVQVTRVFGQGFWTSEGRLQVVIADVSATPVAPAVGDTAGGTQGKDVSRVPRPPRPVPTAVRKPPRVSATGGGRSPLDDDALFASVVDAITTAGRALSTTDLEAPTGVSRPTLHRRLGVWVDEGRIRRHGSTRNASYSVPGMTFTAASPATTAEHRAARILAALEQQTAPIAPRELAALLKIDRKDIRDPLAALLRQGRVVACGHTTSRVLGVPRVMAPTTAFAPATPAALDTPAATPEAPVQATEPPRKPRASAPTVLADREPTRLSAEIVRVLRSGASYDPREIRRNVLGAFPSITVDDIVEVCDAMAKEGRIARHQVGASMRRYQLRVSPK